LDPAAKIKNLSRGQRARTGLLVALAHRPELLLLDEPSSGLDPVVRRDILGAIIRTIADEGRTVVFSSHLLDEVERVADHVAILHQGRVVLSAPVEHLKETHRRVTLRFDQARDQAPPLVGAISWAGAGAEWTYVCSGEGPQVRRAAEAIGAQVVGDASLTLDEIFVSRVQS
jgi:ABC-2 type transport system ATP-binding protein